MKVRSITVFVPDGAPAERLPAAGAFLANARRAAARHGLDVQTVRAALRSPHQVVADLAALAGAAPALAALAAASGIDYLSLGSVDPAGLEPAGQEAIAAALAHDRLFLAAPIAGRATGVSFEGAGQAASLIRRLSTVEANGFANLRFSVLANCPPGVPFFPAAHAGGPAGFAIAWQAADLAVKAFSAARDAADAVARLQAAMERVGRDVEALAAEVETPECPYLGSDCSLAPFPESAASIGHAVEALGVPWFGAHGTLTVAALVTEATRRARLRRTGFSGLMLAVLEDNVLAARAAEGRVGLTDLLLYSAVCGTGLDVCPLPGDVSAGALTAVLLDVATLAVVLDKPLTARLMPVPGAAAGDPTEFDFPFFAPSRIMDVAGPGLTGALAASRGAILAEPVDRHSP